MEISKGRADTVLSKYATLEQRKSGRQQYVFEYGRACFEHAQFLFQLQLRHNTFHSEIARYQSRILAAVPF